MTQGSNLAKNYEQRNQNLLLVKQFNRLAILLNDQNSEQDSELIKEVDEENKLKDEKLIIEAIGYFILYIYIFIKLWPIVLG